MSYDVCVRCFAGGDTKTLPFAEVAAILRKFGSIDEGVGSLEFTPDGEGMCEYGFIDGDEDRGIDSVIFSRPDLLDIRLRSLVFDLLGIPGMCYFEQDVIHIYARSNLTEELPEGFLEESSAGRVTVISSEAELDLNCFF